MSPLSTAVRNVEDFSIATVEVLRAHRLATLADVLAWPPPADLHPLVFDNIQAIFDELGFDWPPN